MPESFGARLRQHREERAIELTTIAEQTKIKRSLLEALEKDDISHWPPGIFRRSWVRSYALAIGLDPDQAVRDFLEQHPEPVPVEAVPAEPAPAAAASVRGIINGWFQRRPPAPIAIEPPAKVVVSEPAVAPPIPAPASVAPIPAPSTARVPDLKRLAEICSELGRVNSAKDIQGLLGDAADVLDAKGLIAWVWDHRAEALRPAFVHGYEAQFVARLPTVGRDAHNLTAAAF